MHDKDFNQRYRSVLLNFISRTDFLHIVRILGVKSLSFNNKSPIL